MSFGCLSYCVKIHVTERLPFEPFLSAPFSGITYILNFVPLSPLWSSGTFWSPQTETLSPLVVTPHHLFPRAKRAVSVTSAPGSSLSLWHQAPLRGH